MKIAFGVNDIRWLVAWKSERKKKISFNLWQHWTCSYILYSFCIKFSLKLYELVSHSLMKYLDFYLVLIKTFALQFAHKLNWATIFLFIYWSTSNFVVFHLQYLAYRSLNVMFHWIWMKFVELYTYAWFSSILEY